MKQAGAGRQSETVEACPGVYPSLADEQLTDADEEGI